MMDIEAFLLCDAATDQGGVTLVTGGVVAPDEGWIRE